LRIYAPVATRSGDVGQLHEQVLVCSLFAAPENAEPPSRPDGLTE
jgi:hypothetical protein